MPEGVPFGCVPMNWLNPELLAVGARLRQRVLQRQRRARLRCRRRRLSLADRRILTRRRPGLERHDDKRGDRDASDDTTHEDQLISFGT
jgi:hypothetical protein